MYQGIAYFVFAILLCVRAGASIGRLTEVTGPTQIVRGSEKLDGKIGTELEQQDTIETLKARVSITFDDDTQMQLTEYSKLMIDEFVYDSSSKNGKLSMKTAFGTVRYASGLIAKNSRENVKVETPTAKISVRGTDFSMTVSEDGRSLVVLLPSLPRSSGPGGIVGIIEVSNAGGSVIMDQAYQATMISSLQSAPSAPIILQFQDESKINNMIMVESPKGGTNSASKETKKNNGTQSASNSNNGDAKANKKTGKADSPTTIAQAEGSSTVVKEEVKEVPVESFSSLDLNLLQPITIEMMKPLVDPKVTGTTGGGIISVTQYQTDFTRDGVNATLNITTVNGTIHYRLKDNADARFTITDRNGTTVHDLNFADKLKINITQK